ncbi:serine-threonine/tyrosine-protein kinase catalytic domain-containing protein [Tanacetum coccineum]
MFSPDHCDYACYLVFKLDDRHVLPNDGSIFNAVYFLGDNEIRIPILKPQEETGSSKTSDRMSILFDGWLERSWVEKRDDGWLEARLTKPLYKHHLENCEELKIELIECRSVNGIIVEGVEFRPVVVDRPYVVDIDLHYDQDQRPAMDIVTEELQETLSIQNEEGIDDDEDEYWEKKLPDAYQRYIEMSEEGIDEDEYWEKKLPEEGIDEDEY